MSHGGGGAGGAEVRPLAEVGLAEDHRAGLAQPGDVEGVGARAMGGQCKRAGGIDHRHRVDVVLEQDREAVQRAAQLAGAAFGVQRVGFLQRRGIGFDHRVEPRAGIVDRGDAV